MGEKRIIGAVEGRGALIRERGEGDKWRGSKREHAARRGSHKKNTSSKPLTGKTRGADNCESLQPVELKEESLEVHALSSVEPHRCCEAPAEKEGQGPGAVGAI